MTKDTLAQVAYSALRADLLSCRLVPGEPIRISSTVSRLGVNLSAVREALSRLVAEGLVTAIHHRGFRAAPISLEDLQDLTSVRIEIESSCLKRSLRVGDLAWESGLVAAYHRLSKTEVPSTADSENSDAFALAHDGFHDALVAACDSEWLLRLRGILYHQSERYRRLAEKIGRHDRNLDAEHEELFNACIARDEAKASELINNHLRRTASVLLDSKDSFNWEGFA